MVATELRRLEVKQYTYRSALVGEHFLEVPRKLLSDFEDALAKRAGGRADNHTVYRVTFNDGGEDQVTYVWFTDNHVLFGRKVVEGRF